MNAVANLVTRHSRWVLFGFIALLALSTIWGFQSFGQLKAGGYDNPGADSGVVSRILQHKFKEASPDAVVLVDFKHSADAPESVAIGAKFAQTLNDLSGIKSVTSYYTLGSPGSLRSTDGKEVYFFAYFEKSADQAATGQLVQKQLTGWYHGARIYAAGASVVTSSISETISSDIARAESIAVPTTIVLLVLVFGSVASSGLPFIVAIIAALGSFLAMYIASRVADTSIFGVNLITGLALGLGIDYALLIVNRYREERQTRDVSESVAESIRTAGRTVFFSGLTVAVVMLALGFFPQYFLRTFAVAGVSVVIFAVLGALFALPAAMNLLGDRVDSLKVLRGSLKVSETGLWERVSRNVMRRPLPVLFVVLLALAGLASLGKSTVFGLVDDRILPKTAPVVIANDQIRHRFTGREGTPIEIVLGNPSQNELISYTNELSKVGHIVRVQSPLGITQNGVLDAGYAPAFAGYTADGLTRVQAITNIDSRTNESSKLIARVRALNTGIHYVRVGGAGAIYADSLLGISQNLPRALIWLAAATMILLFFFTGSVLLPIKAVLLNLLSLGATMGFLSWVFQGGNLHWLVGDFQVTGSLDSSTMVLVAIIAFGLSMDYELFLLSRIKEQHDRGRSTIDSVSYGLQHSGRLITTAALVLAVSFFAFVTSGVTIMKLLGLGVAFAILLDATVVRALLVPALMRLFGEFNWWAPKWLKRVQQAVGLEH
jgi:RND superfamily putative drug exporter